MTWNYRVSKTHDSGEILYGIVEVYYDEEGEVVGWSDFIDPNYWDNPEDLKGTLKLMLEAFDKPLFEGDTK